MTTRERRTAMTVYIGKILELVAIEKRDETAFLRIKFPFEQEEDLFWQVDRDTAENLMAISKFDENHKYRLSLHSTLNTSKEYISYITKTYRDRSERIYFSCSIDYKKELDSIKNIQSICDIKKLPFIFSHLSKTDKKIPEINAKQHQEDTINRSKLPTKWASLAMISAVFFILFGYSNHTSSSKPENTKIMIPHAEVKTAEVNLVNNTGEVKSVSNLAKDESAQFTFPSVEVSDPITFSIPEGYVSLTFDDGPSKYTMEIVDILRKYEAGGTFFFIGSNVKKYPNIVQYVQKNEYSIGSHSMNHLVMSDLPYEKQEFELLQGSQAIEKITNQKVNLFRPPYAAFNEDTKEATHQNNHKMILWNRDTKDWKTRNADKIFDYIRSTDSSGSIILLHESQAVIDALPKIIEHLQEQNLTIVNLE